MEDWKIEKCGFYWLVLNGATVEAKFKRFHDAVLALEEVRLQLA